MRLPIILNHPSKVNMLQKRGAFIVIEGLDGSGKTTQAKLLTAKLSRSHNAVYTAEPSRGKIGAFIRDRCLYGEKRLSTTVEALLFAADRIEHVENEIKPAIANGRLVVCDRYVYSSLAYQGSADLSVEWIAEINKYALKPDFAVFIDVAPEKVLQRLNRRKSVMENLETQRKVREIYLKSVAKGDLTRIDGDKPLEEVREGLAAVVLKFLETF
jgi:dTMP kinase